MTSTTVTYLIVGAFVIYAVRIIVATIRNAPVRDDFEPTSCPPIDADTVLRKYLEADWPEAS